MTFEFSHYYCRFLDGPGGDRLDALYNDTIFDIIQEHPARKRIPFVALGDVVEFLNVSRDPRETPGDEFVYVDIGSIDTVRGTPLPEVMLGWQATSSRMRRVMQEGNILVSTTRPTRGAICIVPEELDNQICSTGFAVLKCKRDMLNKFLFYALRSSFVTMQLERFCSGSGYPAINQEKDLAKVLVPKPSLEVQADVVRAVEALEIEAQRFDRQVRQKQEITGQIFLAELGVEIPPAAYFFKSGREMRTFCFAVFPAEIENRLHYLFFKPHYQGLDILRKRFRTVTLSDICREPIIRGEQPDYGEVGDVVVLKTVNLKNGYIDYKDAFGTSQEFLKAHAVAQLKKGDILVASTGYVSMGKVDVFDWEGPAMADTHISVVRVNEDYDPYFVACFLRSHFGQLQFEKWFTGSSGQIEVQPQDLGKFVLPASSDGGISLDEQRRISLKVTRHLDATRVMEQQAKQKWLDARKQFEKLLGL